MVTPSIGDTDSLDWRGGKNQWEIHSEKIVLFTSKINPQFKILINVPKIAFSNLL